jgi:hypothetical protein
VGTIRKFPLAGSFRLHPLGGRKTRQGFSMRVAAQPDGHSDVIEAT